MFLSPSAACIRALCAFQEHAQDGLGIKRAAPRLGVFLSPSAACIRALCALQELAQDGLGIKRAAPRFGRFLSPSAACIRALCAFQEHAQDGLGIKRAAPRFGVFLPPSAACIRALCAFQELAQDGHKAASSLPPSAFSGRVKFRGEIADKTSMIRLTRLNLVPFVVNCDLIEHVEVTPDTVIALTTGQKFLVRESAEEVIQRVIEFRREVLRNMPSHAWPQSPPGASSPTHKSAPQVPCDD